ncbi:hypothetical protein WJX72_012409 [[Myrmecia] bisecta]|uniref:cyclin-dependent kinase n=1 Tax=[Myrmecia] bisecta TaxID=41462 RepID=A0AAW1PQ93_9CHLO
MEASAFVGEPPASLSYEVLGQIGEGAFGEVVQAIHKQTGQEVALKRVFVRQPERGLPDNVVREMHALQVISHPNVIRLLEVYPQGSTLVLVTEFCPLDLSALLHWAKAPISEGIIKAVLQQLMRGLATCHEAGIMHRDVKPSNILLSRDGLVKLADFGMARPVDRKAQARYTHTVATRWYRAPELLYGARAYTTAVDMWAAGCVFAEMLGGGPLLPGETDIDQLGRVIHLFGSVDEAAWPEARALPDYNKICFAPCQPQPLRDVLAHASDTALQLLGQMLHITPGDRLTAAAILEHAYFVEEPQPASQEQVKSLLLSCLVRKQAEQRQARKG